MDMKLDRDRSDLNDAREKTALNAILCIQPKRKWDTDSVSGTLQNVYLFSFIWPD